MRWWNLEVIGTSTNTCCPYIQLTDVNWNDSRRNNLFFSASFLSIQHWTSICCVLREENETRVDNVAPFLAQNENIFKLYHGERQTPTSESESSLLLLSKIQEENFWKMRYCRFFSSPSELPNFLSIRFHVRSKISHFFPIQKSLWSQGDISLFLR